MTPEAVATVKVEDEFGNPLGIVVVGEGRLKIDFREELLSLSLLRFGQRYNKKKERWGRELTHTTPKITFYSHNIENTT